MHIRAVNGYRFFNRVSVFALLTMFFNDPATLLNTILTIPLSWATLALSFDAYPPSVTYPVVRLYTSQYIFIDRCIGRVSIQYFAIKYQVAPACGKIHLMPKFNFPLQIGRAHV